MTWAASTEGFNVSSLNGFGSVLGEQSWSLKLLFNYLNYFKIPFRSGKCIIKKTTRLTLRLLRLHFLTCQTFRITLQSVRSRWSASRSLHFTADDGAEIRVRRQTWISLNVTFAALLISDAIARTYCWASPKIRAGFRGNSTVRSLTLTSTFKKWFIFLYHYIRYKLWLLAEETTDDLFQLFRP